MNASIDISHHMGIHHQSIVCTACEAFTSGWSVYHVARAYRAQMNTLSHLNIYKLPSL